MKRGSIMLFKAVVVSGFLICTMSKAHAGATYTTHDSNGKTIATFTQVEGPGSFGKAWKDPSGMIWSSYQGDFSNHAITPDPNNVVSDSPATRACAKIGGSLPSGQDYLNLMKNFEMTSDGNNSQGDLLTDQGYKDLFMVFRDMASGGYGSARTFWSSSLHPLARDYAYHFGGYSGSPYTVYQVRSFNPNSSFDPYSFAFRNSIGSVRCVSR